MPTICFNGMEQELQNHHQYQCTRYHAVGVVGLGPEDACTLGQGDAGVLGGPVVPGALPLEPQLLPAGQLLPCALQPHWHWNPRPSEIVSLLLYRNPPPLPPHHHSHAYSPITPYLMCLMEALHASWVQAVARCVYL